MFKFLIVGGLNTLLAYGLFAIFIAYGLHYTVATLLPGLLTIYLGYVANKKVVFRSRGDRQNGVALYYLFYLLLYLLNIGIQAMLHLAGFSSDYVNGALAIGVTTVVSFLVNRFYFFDDSPGRF